MEAAVLETLDENTSDIEMKDDGSVIVHESWRSVKDAPVERINEIREKIADPDSDPADISRAIAVEIAVVAGNMVAIDGAMMSAPQLKAFSEQVRALRVLGKQLSDAELLSKKDVLNFDNRNSITSLRPPSTCLSRR